jgi:hypothetical protein
MMPCSPMKGSRALNGSYFMLVFVNGLLFDSEDGDDIFSRNIT